MLRLKLATNVKHLLLVSFLLFIHLQNRKRLNSNEKIINIFITNNFYYENARIYERNYKNSMIVLFNVERNVRIEVLRKDSYCITYSQSGWPKLHKADIEGIIGEKADFECKISVYRLFCSELILNSQLTLKEQNVQIKLSRHSKQFPISLKRADHKPKKMVVCPSRLFAFDQWNLFITAMELYRAHGVELVLVYIQSVDKTVFQLICAYKESGLLQLRPALQMPQVDTLDYNPNSETSWQNQLINFQDCLYEFRESAEFIAFPDWDDFMFTRNYNIPYYNVLNKLAKESENNVGFIVDRYMGVHESLDEMTEKEHTIYDFWRIGVQFSKKNIQIYASNYYGKAIYRPNNGLYGVDLHWANRVESDKFKQIRVPMKEMYIIHARDYSNYSMNGYIKNTYKLEKSFQHFVQKYNLTNLINQMPKREILVKHFNDCLGFNSHLMGKIVQKSTSKCWNYHQCTIKQMRSNCVNVKNKWQKIPLSSKELVVYILNESNFEAENLCSY